jgi:hypothetical protein
VGTDANHTGSASGTLTIEKASQTITFGILANQQTGAAPLTLTATVSSGLSVTFSSSNAAVAKVSGDTLIIVGKGTATITATQAGNGNFLAATAMARTLNVSAPAKAAAPSAVKAAIEAPAASASVAPTAVRGELSATTTLALNLPPGTVPSAIIVTLVHGSAIQFNSVTTNGSIFVAVGATSETPATSATEGMVESSPDGVAWTVRAAEAGTDAFNSVVANGNLFVAVGDGGAILTSPNGIDWTPRSSGTAFILTAVTWDGTEFVAVGIPTAGDPAAPPGILLTSPDGETWTTEGQPKTVDSSDESSPAIH